MRMRPPATPLIAIDPYFSVWSHGDKLTTDTAHWTGKSNAMLGIAEIDGTAYRFMGVGEAPEMKQTGFNMDAMSTEYTFEAAGVRLECVFTSPLLMDDLDLLTRPVSYMYVKTYSADGKAHEVKVSVSVSEELCLNYRGQFEVTTEKLSFNGITAVKMGSVDQPVLKSKGDDIRIDWGYVYLCSDGDVSADITRVATPHADCTPEEARRVNIPEMTFITLTAPLATDKKSDCLFAFAYDDIKSILYFEDELTSYWNKDGKTIIQAITEAFGDYEEVKAACDAFGLRMFADAVRAGGEKYAEILELAYRSTIAAHKLVLDTEGKILFVSKECHSNGCAATVDVSYPSIPLFLIYNPELVRGMMRPVFKFARRKDMWPYDFAPHDVGTYPHLTCQVYSYGTDVFQMPVEECGNMIVMAAAASIADNDASFAAENMDLLEQWVGYLIKHGKDPENQLCTDDFAGHLAHNCNLSLKAISGIAGLGIIYKMLGREEDSKKMLDTAAEFASDWAVRASNGDGSYRLAFDREGSWSMKYNIVWDKLWGTGVMPANVIESEFATYRRHINRYGMPLDIRADYTKSDWLVWTATLASNRNDFEDFVAPLWENYNATKSRVVMTDWYDTVNANQVGFRHRSVQGGLYIKLLESTGKMKV